MNPCCQTPLRIGQLTLSTPVLLAPMAGYSDLPFRLLIRALGGVGLAFTEMLNPRSILAGRGKRRQTLLATAAEDSPLGYQIYGTDAALMTDAARWLQDHGASLIDLNMGCPQRKISARGAGAGLLRQPAAAVALTARIVGAVGVPVTVKIRLGWDRDSLVAVELARELERAGIAALTVHGRTRGQGYLGEADRDAIGQVVAAVSTIPVIGNGDILSPETARRMLTETGCAGIMLGRGALREPWLIRDIWQALQGLPPLPPPARGERLRLMLRHLDAMLRHYGEPAGAVLFRKWIPHYAAKLGWPRPAMVRLLHIADPADLRSALNAEG